ncbi:GPI mannosyltransferase 3-like [Branchiostoma lanceolatum]|uniref:GPI mannosyltransferase 3-like n=1 Tax=Branchiostoma lanceolatum TaxID=7740 RepID=UPI00345426E9
MSQYNLRSRRPLKAEPGGLTPAGEVEPSVGRGAGIEPSVETTSSSSTLLSVGDGQLFLMLLTVRLLNAAVVQTAHVPDEYWQSLEVAHNMVFGYGYLTWEWQAGLRGFTYPLVFAALYKILAVFRLDSVTLLVLLPRLLQGLFTALCDLQLYKVTRKLHGKGVAQWTLLCQLLSWFMFYCGPRTLTNSMETVLTTAALYYYPWPQEASTRVSSKQLVTYLSLAALSCLVRPTAAIMWIPLCILHLVTSRSKLHTFALHFIPVGLGALAWSAVVDRIFHGKWVLVQYNFLEFNVLSNLGSFYGSHPWHWYLTQGFPVTMATQLLPFVFGAVKLWRKQKLVLFVILWTVMVYSFLGHKEFRFIMPVVPLAMISCGLWLHWLSPWLRFTTMAFLLVTNLPLALYTSLVHQRGTVDVMSYLSQEADRHGRDMSVLFLMPCHSTPFYSHVHHNISMRFLECPPDLERRPGYMDEADIFYQNPSEWLKNNYGPDVPLPTHLVMFNTLHLDVEDFIAEKQFSKCAEYFHTHIPLESRLGNYVEVYCQQEAT